MSNAAATTATTVTLGDLIGTIIRSGFGFALVSWDNGAQTTVDVSLLKEVA